MNVLKKSRSTGVVPPLETNPLLGSTRLTKLNLQNLLLKLKQNCFSNGNKGISKKHFSLLLFNHRFFRYSPTPEIMFSASTAPLFYISCNVIDEEFFSLEWLSKYRGELLHFQQKFLNSYVLYVLDAITSSGILKGKQKLDVTFNSDKLCGIDFTNFSKLTMCSA